MADDFDGSATRRDGDDLDNGETLRGLRPGQRVFGRFVLETLVGRGGFGLVYQAKDEELSRTVALKFLPEAVAADEAEVMDLKRRTLPRNPNFEFCGVQVLRDLIRQMWAEVCSSGISRQ